ncbi:hypothetical protein LTR37_019835 [Vermiconidia calcicola]|uniref:Uncharacterized protein n=1 Tax=Vermiconidia calcicola TaxID=1690605 RepID=A0ACC3ME71_9PEZI|nr:hypothetical protein LTR37_019835 [Vermiconidia calcicola]
MRFDEAFLRNKRQAKKDKEPTPPLLSDTQEIPRALLNPTDKINLCVAEAVDFWNNHILTTNVPAHLPFQRKKHEAKFQVGVPGVLQHLFLVSTWTIWITKSGSDPLRNRTLCQSRGLAFRGLNRMLSTAVTDVSGYALACTIMALMADFGLSQAQAWEFHLDAVRKIVQCRGGFQACMAELPDMRQLFLTFLVLDVLTAAFRETSRLGAETVATQAEYVALLPNIEQQLVLNGDPGPQVLLQAIVQVTALRIEIRRSSTERRCKVSTLSRAGELYHQIRRFDPQAWAVQVVIYGRTRPEHLGEQPSEQSLAAWSTLALCYQSAALLYLLLSVPTGHQQAVTAMMIAQAESALASEINAIFALADPDPDAAVGTQLWKFTNWPLLISLRTRQAAVCNTGDVRECLARLEEIAVATGIRSWLAIGIDMILR